MYILLTAIVYYSVFVVESISAADCAAVKNDLQCCLSVGFDAPAIRRRSECMSHVNNRNSSLLTKKGFYKCRLTFRRFKKKCNLKCQDLDGKCIKPKLKDNQHCWQSMKKISNPEINKKVIYKISNFAYCEEKCMEAGSECQQLEYYPEDSICAFSSALGDLIDVSDNYIAVEMSCYNAKSYPECKMAGKKVQGDLKTNTYTDDPIQCANGCEFGIAMSFHVYEGNEICTCYYGDYNIESIQEYGAKRSCFS